MKKPTKKNSGKKKTIVLCSSASFYKQVLDVRDALKKLGFKVLVPLTAGKMEKSGDFKVETYKTWFADSNAYDRKRFLTKHHFDKIAEGDSILVLNYEKNGKPGYIGGAVLMEMGVALHLGKKVYILNPIDETVGYKEEILGMLPVILNGDLNLIK
ncbi:MAG: hypothetical protein KGI49_00485 [Patescibacteria group bacterium]|nr:hypothetical protein [Patescibacteria group bacterium]